MEILLHDNTYGFFVARVAGGRPAPAKKIACLPVGPVAGEEEESDYFTVTLMDVAS